MRIESQPATSSKKSSLSKRLKIIAGIFFAVAFISQNTLSVHWSSKEKVLQEAMTGFVHAHASSMLLLNLFYSGSKATERVQNEIVIKAANEAGLALSMLVAVTDFPKDEREAEMNKIMVKAAQVKDLDSCNEFIEMVDTSVNGLSEKVTTHLRKIIQWKGVSLWVYGVFYLIASVAAVLGIKFE